MSHSTFETVSAGTNGVFGTLVQQHAEAAALLSQLKQTSDPTSRLQQWSKLRLELLSHEKSEIRVLYPELRGIEATRDIADAHDEEAETLEATIHQLDKLDTASSEWTPKLETLGRLLTKHVQEEEGEFFPRALAALGEEKSQDLDARIVAEKTSVMGELA